MFTLIAMAAPAVVLGAFDVLALKFGAEDRPGFDERRPLN
jgi:hypothetical protein